MRSCTSTSGCVTLVVDLAAERTELSNVRGLLATRVCSIPKRGSVRIPRNRGRTHSRPDHLLMGALSVVPHPATGPAPHLSQRSRVVPLGQGPSTVLREHVSVLADWEKDDENEDSRRWGSTCVARDFRTPGRAAPLRRQRQTLTVGAVAARLELRLYLSEPTQQAVDDGCGIAIRQGLASVIVRPEVVPTVGPQLAGTSVGVVSVPGWRDRDVEPPATKALLAEARRLAADGATDLGMVANVERLRADHGGRFADDVIALVEAMHACGARVRVVLDTDGMTPDATAAACELLGSTGVWLVQGGSWRGTTRTGLSRIQLMRAALPDEVRLKWTLPIRTLDSMMIGIAEGVDLYNGDPKSLLEDAAHRVSARPLLVPVRGVDY